MKKELSSLLSLVCVFSLGVAGMACGADALAEGFADPPAESRPRTWWHWMDNNISRAGITKDLEAMKRAGLGGATILDIAEFRHDKGTVKSLSPEWYGMVNWAGREADRLGLSLSFHNCPGWSSSGGPWIKPENAMKMMCWTETVVTGGAPVRVRLPACPSPVGFSRDVAVVAFPSVPGDAYDVGAYTPVATNVHLDAALKTPAVPKGCAWVVGTRGAKTEQWLEYAFRAPVEIGTVRMRIGPQFAQYHLNNQVTCAFRVSDDGTAWRTHYVSDSTQKEDPTVFSFPPVTTRHLRVVFRRVGRTNTGWAAIRGVDFAPGERVPHASRKAYHVFFRNAFADIPYVPTNVQPCRAESAVDRARVQVVSDKMAPDGTLAWTPPAPGSWTVLRFMMVARRSGNHPVNPEAHGLECDKLSRAGVDAALGGMMTRIMDDARQTGVKAFKYTLVDSYEVGAQNWTDGMEKTFRARRGYAIEPFLPALTGRYVTDADVTERFLQDFRWLVSTLYAEVYGDYFASVCHAKGLLFENEPYVGPFDEMRLGRAADVPMGEFWHGAPDSLGTARLAGNLGDVYARRYVQTETFTSGDKSAAWTSYPEDHKVQGDAAFCTGVNRFVFHSYAHQPFDTPGPGVTMGPWGFHFNRHNTLWEFYPGWLGYLGRAQFLLQQGRGVADVLYVTRENVPVKADWRPELPFGWKGNCCGADLFMNGVTVRDGCIALPSGMTYRLLALPQTEEPSPAYLRAALALVEAGAEVWLGPRPTRAFGLVDYPACDAEVARLAARLWDGFAAGAVEKRIGKGRVWRGLDFADVLARLAVPSDFAFDAPPSGADVKFIHRALPDRDVYFVANVATKAGARMDGTARFRATGAVEFWNADDGSRFSVPGCRPLGNGVTAVPLRLAPTESVFVVFRRDGGAGAPPLPQGEPKAVADLSGGWTVVFQPGRGAPAGEIPFPRLARFDLSDNAGIRHFSGTATYRRTFRLDAPPAHAWLDLGGVHDVARVFVNGKDCGFAWHTPFRVEVAGALRAGENTVEVQVANRWVNRLVGDEDLPVEGEWKTSPGHPETTRLLAVWPDWFRAGRPAPGGRIAFSTCRPYAKGDPLVPAGLEGPVRLMTRERTSDR